MKGIKLIIILLLSTVGITAVPAIEISNSLVPFGHRKTTSRNIDVVVVHSTFNASGGEKYNKEKIISQFRRYGVAAHYLIDRDGSIYQLVADLHVAYHAGKSKLPDGSSNLNSRSIGIELMNDTIDEPTEEQYDALIKLTEALCDRFPVRFFVRHSDIAPDRKTDPWNTDWQGILNRLAERKLQFTMVTTGRSQK